VERRLGEDEERKRLQPHAAGGTRDPHGLGAARAGAIEISRPARERDQDVQAGNESDRRFGRAPDLDRLLGELLRPREVAHQPGEQRSS